MNSEEDILKASKGKTAGQILKAEREARGLSIQDVGQATKIQPKHIKAIEDNDNESMPSRVYAIGFVRTYSNYMGFEPEFMIQLFKIKTVGRHDVKELDMTADVDSQVLITWPTLAIINILCLISMLVIWSTLSGNKQKFEIPEVSKDLKVKLEMNERALEEFKASTEQPSLGIIEEKSDIPLDSEEPSSYVEQEETVKE